MIYKIEMFNVIFYIIAKNAEEKEVIDIWWQYFIQDPERGRVSVVLAFLKAHKLDFRHKWSYCNKLSLCDNWRAYRGFKRQMREFYEG